MKNLFLILGTLFILSLGACSEKEEFQNMLPSEGIENSTSTFKKIPPPGTVLFDVYKGSAFCTDAEDQQIQIWAPTLDDCDCLLDEFIAECDGQIYQHYPCALKSSKYPPSEACTQ